MLITSKLEIDLRQPGFKQIAYAVQNDSNTRALEISLFLGSTPWEIPPGTTAAVSFRKMDLTSGLYDTLPDGSTKAVTFSENILTAILAPQVLTCVGQVDISIALYDSSLNRLGVFPILMYVSPDPSAGKSISNNYYYLSTLAAVNEAIGNLNDLKTVTKESLVEAINEIISLGGGTITEDQIQAAVDKYLEANPPESTPLDTTLTKAGYAADAKATGEAISNVSKQNQNGGGLSTTAANLLLTILRNGVYSTDQSANITALAVALESGESTGGGDSGGESEYYGITNNLTNVSTDNNATYVVKNSAYTATLSMGTSGTFSAVNVTMGGVDVTADVYADGVINIESVTGDVVITATAATLKVLNGYSFNGVTSWIQAKSGRTNLGLDAGGVAYATDSSATGVVMYPIPVPASATKISVTASVKVGVVGLTLDGNTYSSAFDSGWLEVGAQTVEFEAGAYDFVSVNLYSGTIGVSEVTINFE